MSDALTIAAAETVELLVALAIGLGVGAAVALLAPRARELKWLLVAFASGALLAGGAVLLLAPAVEDRDAQPPGEYLYLDSDRVETYLGQIKGGLSGSEERSLTRIRKREAGAQAGGVSLAGSQEEQNFVKAVVTPTAADRFYDLRELLDDAGRIETLDGTEELGKKLDGLKEGDFVEIESAHLRIPSYAALFPKANYAEQLVPAGKRAVQPRLLAPLVRAKRAKLQQYFDLVAPRRQQPLASGRRAATRDFRLPFILEQSSSNRLDDHDPSPRVFVPLRNSRLALEPGLMSGNLRILAKVARVLKSPSEKYFDVRTVQTFGPALLQADRFVRQRARVSEAEAKRNTVEAVVSASATVHGPGMVLIPIAAYK